MHYELVGPKTANAVLNYTQLEGAVGRGHKAVDKAVTRLLARDGFELRGDTRLKKFTRTIASFTRGGACTGALLGTGIMIVPDLLTGRGRIRKEFERDHFMDKGILGYTGLGLTTATSVIGEAAGAATAGAIGALNPAGLMTKKKYPQWIKTQAKGGQKLGGGLIACSVGGVVGLTLSAVRLPSLFFKYAMAGVMAVPSAVIGFLGGSIRAIINK